MEKSKASVLLGIFYNEEDNGRVVFLLAPEQMKQYYQHIYLV